MLNDEAEDGEISVIHRYSLKIGNPVDTSTPGTYEITYSYTNSDQTGKVRLVVVVEEG